MMKLSLKHITLVLLVGFLAACTKEKGPFLTTEVTDINSIDTISYLTHIQPIFNTSCTNCHNASHSKLDLQATVSYNQLLYTGFSASYVNVSNPSQSKLYLHLTGALAIMPPSGAIQQSNQDLVLKWIEQGALNN